MASIFLALRNPEKLKTRFPGSLRLGRPPVELRAETNFTRTSVLPSTGTGQYLLTSTSTVRFTTRLCHAHSYKNCLEERGLRFPSSPIKNTGFKSRDFPVLIIRGESWRVPISKYRSLRSDFMICALTILWSAVRWQSFTCLGVKYTGTFLGTKLVQILTT